MTVEKLHFLGVDAILASPRMRELFAQVRRAAQSNSCVLLTGEPGCGKEIIARAIHHFSPRGPNPFVDLSFAALPEELVESELFGHERGAYSGANSTKPGLFELAHKGSLFLDEAGEMDQRLQAKLFRVLDTGSFFRLGAVKATRADVRIIAAGGAALPSAAAAGSFRQDLFQRLSQITLVVPPLRERPEDIEVLATHFLSQQNPELRLASDAILALYTYQWPGNVRELRNTVLRSALMAKGPLLHADDILFTPRPVPDSMQVFAQRGLDGLEQAMIRRALEDSGGHRQRAADSLGISKSTLSRKIRAYGLTAPPDRSERSRRLA
jgi:transcriptional regulator with PAS, ATPase and Fis domain